MQIHELNQPKKSQVNEINWGSMFSSAQLGAAQQAATQTAAAKSAAKLANPGVIRRALGNPAYNVGGGTKPVVTTAQQLQAVTTNPAVQQQVKNLSSQWASQSGVLKQQQQSTTVTEASPVQFDPRELADNPNFQSMYQAIKKQTGIDAKAEIELEKKLTNWEQNFKSWADPRLAAEGVSVDDIERDPETAKMLKQALTKLAVSAQSGNANLEKAAAEEYFNIAIAGIQAYINNRQQASAPRASGGASNSAAPTDAEILTQLQQQGVSMTKAELEKLGQIMAAVTGSNVVRSTGNPVLNALARLAGMRVA